MVIHKRVKKFRGASILDPPTPLQDHQANKEVPYEDGEDPKRSDAAKERQHAAEKVGTLG